MMPDETRKRISRPHDLRAVRSRDALRKALLRLVEIRPLEQITIKDITAEAGVSYPVFFRQFSSKEGLLADVATDEVRQLLNHTYPIFDSAVSGKGVDELCAYVQKHRVLWRSLLTTGAAAAMRTEFARIAAEIALTTPGVNPWLPRDLGPAFVASGIFEILAWWLNQPEDYPVRNVVILLDTLLVRSLTEPQDIHLD